MARRLAGVDLYPLVLAGAIALRPGGAAVLIDESGSCAWCGGRVVPGRSDRVYCSAAHKQAAYRERKRRRV